MKRLVKYLKDREVAINSLLKKSPRSFTPEAFHKLRVEIKKLDALFGLVNSCSKDFRRNKTFMPFKLIFRQAGKVREIQVEEALLKKHFPGNSPREYRNSLKKLKMKERADFFSIVNKTSFAKLKKKFRGTVPLIKEIDEKMVSNYMEKKRNKIKELLNQDSLQTEQIHQLRKQLKKYQYSQKSLDEEKGDKASAGKDTLPELLGKWHDCQVMIVHLETVIKTGGIDPKEINELEKIKEKISSDSELLFNEIESTKPASGFFEVQKE